jgi:hypothetical protein
MEDLIKKMLLFALLVSIITLCGFIVPLIVSIFVIITTENTITDCVTTIPFWLFTIIGWIVFSILSSELLEKENKDLLLK